VQFIAAQHSELSKRGRGASVIMGVVINQLFASHLLDVIPIL